MLEIPSHRRKSKFNGFQAPKGELQIHGKPKDANGNRHESTRVAKGSFPQPANMNELISEFFYDGIGRIFPGLLFIILYLHSWLIDTLTEHKEIVVVLLAALVGVGWLVGLTMELITFVLPAGAIQILEKCVSWKWVTKLSKKLLHKSDVITDEVRRRLYHKFCAEKVLFRAMVLISAICLYSPAPILQELEVHWGWIAGCGTVFFLSWLWAILQRQAYFEIPHDTKPKVHIDGAQSQCPLAALERLQRPRR